MAKSFKNFTDTSRKMHITLLSICFMGLYVNHECIYMQFLVTFIFSLLCHQLWNKYPAFRDVKMRRNACFRIHQIRFKSSKGRAFTIKYSPLHSICSRPSGCSLEEKESLLFLPPLKMSTNILNCCFTNLKYSCFTCFTNKTQKVPFVLTMLLV